MFEQLVYQDNIPISRMSRDMHPTFKQFRERYSLSYFEIAQQSKVSVCKVYWTNDYARTCACYHHGRGGEQYWNTRVR